MVRVVVVGMVAERRRVRRHAVHVWRRGRAAAGRRVHVLQLLVVLVRHGGGCGGCRRGRRGHGGRGQRGGHGGGGGRGGVAGLVDVAGGGGGGAVVVVIVVVGQAAGRAEQLHHWVLHL